MLDRGFRLGIVDDLRARAAAVAAANPRQAARILGRHHRPASSTPAVIAAPAKKTGRPARYPWASLAIGEWFDVDGGTATRKSMSGQASQARARYGRRFGVRLTAGHDGRSVIRITRMA